MAFILASERFALPAESVVEVVRAVAMATLPGAPAIVEGAINFRSRVVPVLDIRQRFRLPPSALSPDQHLIVAKANDRLVALRVDQAETLIDLAPEAIETAGLPAHLDLVMGIARLPDGLLVIHDLVSFLSADEGLVLDKVLA